MSAYIKLLTLEYPRYEGDIRLEYPEILESETGDTFPCPETYAPVRWVDAPELNAETQTAYELAPVNADGVWSMVWAVRDMTQEEIDFINSLKKPDLTQQGTEPNVIG
jgi:hypothetical protein